MSKERYTLAGRILALASEHETCWLCRRKATKKFVVEYNRLTKQKKLLSYSIARREGRTISEEDWEQLKGHCRVCCRVCANTLVIRSEFFNLEKFLRRWSMSNKYQLNTIKAYIRSLSELDMALRKVQFSTEDRRICDTNLWALFNYVPAEYTVPRYTIALSVYKELMTVSGGMCGGGTCAD